ncbi:alpha/beta-hydrolase [Cucurbitaria berberidis CBS 394.84]|uniref:Alpha/beta-hydrolase n=1 Tax=Cucurbitaria berberidis CBS 394.84 TaxID=1168544 RepID=A0A9P4GJG1_9PLEO|nr:alpha/beta-hydrolase [Cucurbitaria berberidis CBS 394.84]KAF1847363.1 alpha/beta-hydrolase [Cucurbitaria berberidis CBS 394.84]
MAIQPIDPVSDERIEHKTTKLNGYTYHYLYAVPKGGQYTETVFLIHGWPDLSMGWRYQIPLLVDLGFRVVVPDMMGYGGTDAPEVPPNSIRLYGMKRASDDIAALAKELGVSRVILGGHDWGGFVVWRAAQWYPDLVSHVFSVCTPYSPPHDEYFSVEDLVKGPLPQFAYQLHLASGEVEKTVKDEQSIRQFLKALYGGRGPNGELAFDPEKGVLAENLPTIGESRLLNGKVLDYYVKEYSKHGIHSTLNWYRQRRSNWEEDQALLDKKIIKQPVLFIQATHDSVLKPEMSKSMGAFIPNLTRGEVAASHWALTQTPEEVNGIIRQWFEGQGLGRSQSSL